MSRVALVTGAARGIGAAPVAGLVAEAVAFCASSAGRVVNGTVLHADGGFRP